MLITNESQRSTLFSSLAAQGQTYWRAGELALHACWFVVLIKEADESDEDVRIELTKTLLIFNYEDMVKLVAEIASEGLIEAVYLASPTYHKHATGWCFDRLAALELRAKVGYTSPNYWYGVTKGGVVRPITPHAPTIGRRLDIVRRYPFA